MTLLLGNGFVVKEQKNLDFWFQLGWMNPTAYSLSLSDCNLKFWGINKMQLGIWKSNPLQEDRSKKANLEE